MDDLIAEQIAYYNARAREYDARLRELGRYSSLGGNVAGRLHADAEHRQIATVEAELLKHAPFGRVLELASGTGWWTQLLAANATAVTAIDASEEMLAFNRERVSRTNVSYVLSDVFTWKPSSQYDLVFFGFWLSHVPHRRFESFWQTVRQSLAPGGVVFFVDELQPSDGHPEERIGEDAVLRSVEDGRSFRAVKVFYQPSELEAKLRALGWSAHVEPAGPDFYYGSACPVADRAI